MKIAYTTNVIYPFTIGGSEIRNHEVAKRLVKKGHEVHVYGAKFWEGNKNIEIDGIKIHGLYKYSELYNERTLACPVAHNPPLLVEESLFPSIFIREIIS